MTRGVQSFAACVVAILLLLAGATRAAADEDGARRFISALGDETVDILNRPDLSLDDALTNFRRVFRDGFDIPTIGRFALGRYWRGATPEAQQEYLRLYEELIVETYARRFNSYSGETFMIAGSRQISDRDVLVSTEIVRANGTSAVSIDWRVRERGDAFKIIDVVVEQVSMAVTQRNEFASVIRRGGGIEALLDALRRRIETQRGT